MSWRRHSNTLVYLYLCNVVLPAASLAVLFAIELKRSSQRASLRRHGREIPEKWCFFAEKGLNDTLFCPQLFNVVLLFAIKAASFISARTSRFFLFRTCKASE